MKYTVADIIDILINRKILNRDYNENNSLIWGRFVLFTERVAANMFLDGEEVVCAKAINMATLDSATDSGELPLYYLYWIGQADLDDINSVELSDEIYSLNN